ncbi:MAG: major facilitator superfamily 1, partial [Blastococcus sp.]|nr:major facilitator superfamily 1 [Blastococcus sp.]
TGGAVLGAFAPSFEVLLGARLLQGLGAAAVPTLGMAIVSARYGGTVRTAALGRVAGTAAAVSALGPLAGGLVADLASWRAVVALPALGLLVVPALWRAVPTRGTGGRLDILGAALVAASAAGLVLLVQSPAAGIVVATAGAVLLGLGVPAVAARVRHRPEGFLPKAVIHEPIVVRSALAAAAVPAAWFALLIAVPAVLAAEDWTPLEVGLALVPSALTGFLAPRIAGPVLARLGPSWSLVTSGITAAVALAVAALGAAFGSAPVLVTAVVLVTFAFGLGQPALMAAVGGAVPADVRGVALGIATLVFLVGGGVGSAVVGGIGEVLGLDHSLLLLAVLPLAGCLALVGTIRAERVPT